MMWTTAKAILNDENLASDNKDILVRNGNI